MTKQNHQGETAMRTTLDKRRGKIEIASDPRG
jgi:hypothetical protein